jgi:hypothetical protein
MRLDPHPVRVSHRRILLPEPIQKRKPLLTILKHGVLALAHEPTLLPSAVHTNSLTAKCLLQPTQNVAP